MLWCNFLSIWFPAPEVKCFTLPCTVPQSGVSWIVPNRQSHLIKEWDWKLFISLKSGNIERVKWNSPWGRSQTLPLCWRSWAQGYSPGGAVPSQRLLCPAFLSSSSKWLPSASHRQTCVGRAAEYPLIATTILHFLVFVLVFFFCIRGSRFPLAADVDTSAFWVRRS